MLQIFNIASTSVEKSATCFLDIWNFCTLEIKLFRLNNRLSSHVGAGLRIMDDVGIKIHKLKHLKLHGKMLLADGLHAIIGSINLAPGSFDDRRELAIELHDEDIVDRLLSVARHDWENSHPLDLTDEGLFMDLEEHGSGGSEKLVLRMDDKHRKKHST